MVLKNVCGGRALRIVVGITVLVLLLAGEAGALMLINETGRDCTSFGTWDAGTMTCTMTKDLNDIIQIESNGVILDGNGHTITITGYINAGVELSGRRGVTIKNLNIENGVWGYGIFLSNSSNNYIMGNHASKDWYGIYLTYDSHNNTLSGNNVSNNNGYGIYLSGSDNTLIENNANSNNDKGIYLSGSNNMLIRNNANSNNNHGFYLTNSNTNTLISNNATNNTYYGIFVVSNNNTLRSNNASNNRYGISLSGSNNMIIENNANSNNNGYGMSLFGSNNTLIGNNANSNNNGNGIYLSGSDNTLIGNYANSNNSAGISLVGSNGKLSGNHAANNNIGIYLDGSNNTLNSNDASNNEVGISISPFSYNNIIYNNYFKNKNNFLFSYSYYYFNTWNITKTSGMNIIGGPYLGGNFWAYPNGTGFSQTCTDSDRDGICDSQYNLASDNIDYLPLAYKPATSPTLTLNITSPAPDSNFTLGTPVEFKAKADGGEVPYSYVWISNIDGEIGSGANINVSDLSAGEHRITVSVKDSAGKAGKATINILVSTGVDDPVVSMIKPEAWGYFLEGVNVDLKISADVDDPDGKEDIARVVFNAGGKDYIDTDGADGWSVQINAGGLTNGGILSVIAFDKEGHKSTAKTLQVKTVKIPWLFNPFIEPEVDNGKILYSFSGEFDSSILGDGWSSTTPDYIPIFGGHKHTINPPTPEVGGVWSSEGKGEISVSLDMDIEFSGMKGKWKPKEAGVVKDIIKEMMQNYASGKYSYCSKDPGLCMKKSRYMLTGEIEVGGAGEVVIKNEILTPEQLKAFLNLNFEAEIPTPYSMNIPWVGNQGIVVIIGPHGNYESIYEYSNENINLYNRTIQVGVSGGGKFKLGDEGESFVPFYVEVYVIGDLNVIIIYVPPENKNNVDLCLSGEAGGKVRGGLSWYGMSWEGKIGPYKYPDGCKSGPKTSAFLSMKNEPSSITTLSGWKWEMMRPPAKSNLALLSTSALVKPENTIIYDELPDDYPAVAANKNGDALALWVHGTNISVMPPEMTVYYSVLNGTNWSEPAPVHIDNTTVLNPQVAYYGDDALAVWTGDKGKLDINDTFDKWASTLEIYFSFWNGTSWTIPDRITNDSEADGMPAISSNGNNSIAVWVHDRDSNVSTRNDLDIHYSLWNGTAWSPPSALTSDNLQDYGPKIAQSPNGTAMVVWTRDTDGNSSTDSDKEIYYSVWNGAWTSPAPLTDNNFKDSKAYPVFDGASPSVAWVQSREIPVNVSYFNEASNITEYKDINVSKDTVYFIDYNNGSWKTPVNISAVDFSISDLVLSSDERNNLMAAWRDYNSGNGDITYTVRDPASQFWSPAMKLVNDTMVNWKLSMDSFSNKSVFVWLKHNSTIIFNNSTGSYLESTYDDVYYSILNIKPDLAISTEDIYVPNNLKIGDTIPINFTVHNLGTLNSGNFSIRVINGTQSDGTQMGSDIFVGSINPGGIYNGTISYNISSVNTSIYVLLDPQNEINEISKGNNIAHKNLRVLPDLTLSSLDVSVVPDESGKFQMFLSIRNIGGINISNVSLEVYNEYPPNGTLVYSRILEVPTNGTNVSLSLNITDSSNFIFVVLDSKNSIEEIDETNNDIGYLIKTLPDLMISTPRVTYDPQNGTATINATIRNIGFSNATNISVALIDDTSDISLYRNVLYEWNISSIGMNEHRSISTVINSVDGTNIFLSADPNNTIPEINEFNNIVSVRTASNIITVIPPIKVVSPNGGENWTRGKTQIINWTSIGSPGTYVKIELLKAGVLNSVIIASTLNDGSHPWLIPATQTPGKDYKIRITSTTNASYTDTSDNNFTIPAPNITVITPNAGEIWRRGTTQTIKWNSSGSPGTYVKIELLKGGVLNRVIIASTPNDGTHPWLIPATQAPGTDYTVRITSTTNAAYNDTSDANFTIPVPTITVITPNGGENWTRGTTKIITWNSTESPGTYVKIELLKAGVLNRVIISSTLNDGSHPWLIPATLVPGKDYKVKITSIINISNNDASDDNFIIPTPSINVVSPNGGENWTRGTTRIITWNSTENPGSYVKIELLRPGKPNQLIISATLNDGSHPWLIPAAQAPGSDYKVKITSAINASNNDTSDDNFTIPTPSFKVVSPNGGENWIRGSTQIIKWNSTESPGTYVKIELLKAGVLNRVILASTLNDGSHPWIIPATQTPGDDYKVKITSTTNVSNNDTSDANFTIPVPSITVATPNGGENWTRGTTKIINWNSTESPGTYVKIELLKAGVLNRVIISSTLNDGSHPWLIPVTQATGSDYRVKITSTTNISNTDASNSNFAIGS